MRSLRRQKTGYRKSATVWLLTVAFLFGRVGLFPVTAVDRAGQDPVAILAEGLTDCLAVIDLRGASLPTAELGTVYQALLLDAPELFHVAPRLSYGYTLREGVRVVTEVYPVYTLTGEALTAARGLYLDRITAILADMDAVFGDVPPTEADVVLYLHDRLADDYDYDTRPESEANADAYTFFRDGVGICQAYALAFLALCRGAGLEAHTVASGAMDHAWSHVRVEGAWYHVDVTRDDPIPAPGGAPAVTHTRLLRSDSGMAALGYSAYSCPVDHTCTDTRFEAEPGGAAMEVSQAMVFRGGRWMGTGDDGAPVAVQLRKDGVSVGPEGDLNLDGAVDARDLLAVYDPALPEDWREWVRGRLAG